MGVRAGVRVVVKMGVRVRVGLGVRVVRGLVWTESVPTGIKFI